LNEQQQKVAMTMNKVAACTALFVLYFICIIFF
jgi:hypothetical protein